MIHSNDLVDKMWAMEDPRRGLSRSHQNEGSHLKENIYVK